MSKSECRETQTAARSPISAGPNWGAYAGVTVSHTLLIPIDPIAFMKTIVPSN